MGQSGARLQITSLGPGRESGVRDEIRQFSASTAAFNRPVNVRVPAEVAFDIEKVQQIQKEILGRLGCVACCSGFDIRFILETEFMVDHELNIREAGRFESAD
jgi:hypothetical protein